MLLRVDEECAQVIEENARLEWPLVWSRQLQESDGILIWSAYRGRTYKLQTVFCETDTCLHAPVACSWRLLLFSMEQ